MSFAQWVALGYGAACHGLFLLGVGAMAANLYTGMALGQGPWHGATAVIVNALLLVQFPVVHSLLLRKGGRAWLARLAPAGLGADLSTTTYVIVSSVQLLLLFGLWSYSGTVWWQAQGTAQVVLSVAFLAAWLLVMKGMADAGLGVQAGYLGWLSVLLRRKPAYPDMPEQGLFRFSRQAIYLAFTLTLWTGCAWTPDQLVVALVLTAYCLVGPLHKESRYLQRYGERFARYRARVPYWLPWPRPRTRVDGG